MSTKQRPGRGKASFPRPLGPYVLLQPLGHGGMGEVYLAKHGKVDGIEKFCVVKTLRRAFTEDNEYVDRFIEEARVVVHLGHRNICHVFDVGKVGELYYLAMEFIPGRDLRRVQDARRKAQTTLPRDLALHVGTQVLEALDYAHRHVHPATGEPLGLVHRDVSPQNVMVNLEGEVKLIDFGLAASNRSVSPNSDSGVVIGKLAYMAPEQLDGDAVDPRCDVFSAAVLLYELLTGHRYYEGLERQQIWSAVSEGWSAPRLSEIEPELRAILVAALARAPSDRTSCDELLEQLERYRAAHGLAAGARQLRAFMQTLFPTEQEAVHDMLRRFAATGGAPADVEVEHTTSIASSRRGPFGSLSSEEPTATASLARIPSSGEESGKETARLVPERARAPAGMGRSFAVGAVVVVLAAGLWQGLNLARAPAAEPKAAVAAEQEPADAVPAPRQQPKRDVEAAAPERPPPAVPASPKAPTTTTSAPEQKAPSASSSATPPAVARTAPAPPEEPAMAKVPDEGAAAAKPPERPPEDDVAVADLTFEDKIELFETRCRELACASALATEFRGRSLADVPTQRLATAVDEVRVCLRSCLER